MFKFEDMISHLTAVKQDVSTAWKRLKGVYKARSKVDLELFYGKLADEAESGFKKNNVRPAYRAIKRLRGSTRSSANGSVARSDGSQ